MAVSIASADAHKKESITMHDAATDTPDEPIRRGRPRTSSQKAPRRRGRRRIQMDLLPEVYERVIALQRKNGLDSTQAVFRQGFRLYEWYNARRAEGWGIQLVHPDGRKMYVDLGLDGEPPAAAATLQGAAVEALG
jgi:hypothetical protein